MAGSITPLLGSRLPIWLRLQSHEHEPFETECSQAREMRQQRLVVL